MRECEGFGRVIILLATWEFVEGSLLFQADFFILNNGLIEIQSLECVVANIFIY